MIPPIQHEHGIVTLDADYLRPGLAAVHLIVEDGGVAIVDTGTNHAVPSVLAELRGLGLGPEAVDYVIVTHVHLDHAGAAGALLQNCPNAKLVVHPKGARHMIDPAKLVAGSIAVYGREHFYAHYGDIVPAPAERVIEAGDGFRLDFRGRTLSFLDTPGHARHHYCIHDQRSNSLFTGDTFGISYPPAGHRRPGGLPHALRPRHQPGRAGDSAARADRRTRGTDARRARRRAGAPRRAARGGGERHAAPPARARLPARRRHLQGPAGQRRRTQHPGPAGLARPGLTRAP
ncbi:MAG: beta-lactamase-like protein [bacterium]|nr:MAG: beta-lactamase-like protein [bacterium]